MGELRNPILDELLKLEHADLMTLNEFLKVIETHLLSISTKEICALQPLLHRTLELELEKDCVFNTNVGACISKLIQQHKESEECLTSVLQILYQVLVSLKGKPRDRSLQLLGDVVWYEDMVELLFDEQHHTRRLTANMLACLQVYVQQFEDVQIMTDLWAALRIAAGTGPTVPQPARQALVQLFDEFSQYVYNLNCCPELINLTQRLLLSEVREERKTAYFLLKKIAEAASADRESSYTQRCWTAYISALENLEENQSHLIRPSLKDLEGVEFPLEEWEQWLEILFKKMMQCNNALDASMEYFLKRFNCSTMPEDVLLFFFKAANNTSLYSPDKDLFSLMSIRSFLQGDYGRLFGAVVKVNWKPVPLHFWLSNFLAANGQCGDLPSNELLLKLASCVRKLQNPALRRRTIELFENIFAPLIDAMSLAEYGLLVETLYNVADEYCGLKLLADKLETAVRLCRPLTVTQRCYEIITNNLQSSAESIKNSDQQEALKRVANCILEVNPDDLSWLRFLLIFECDDALTISKFGHLHYGIDFDALTFVSLTSFRNGLIAKLAHTKIEEKYVCEKSVDVFVCQYLKKFDCLAVYNLKVDELLNMGSHRTVLRLSQLLADHTKSESTIVLDAFLHAAGKYAKQDEVLCYQVSCNLLSHCKFTQPSQLTEYYAARILEIDLENYRICEFVLRSGICLGKECYLRGVMFGDFKAGDARIEELYANDLLHNDPTAIRHLYRTHVPDQLLTEVLSELVILNNDISRKRPRYFDSSKEHRLKLRIAAALLDGVQRLERFWSDELIKALLEHNNQLDVNYIYEFLTAKCAPSFQFIRRHLDKMHSYTPSQQVSLMSTAHCYCILNWDTFQIDELEKLLQLLVPLTMGANFQVRLYAQMIACSLLLKANGTGKFTASNRDYWCMHIAAIQTVLGTQCATLMKDARLRLPYIYLTAEYNSHDDYSNYEASRMIFVKKTSTVAKQLSPTPEVDIQPRKVGNVQRKMNPMSEICEQKSLTSYPECALQNEMIVVASLVDKVPNLGGIARTCEILGIKNLVLDSKSCIEKSEFKNVSMTAENGLNIVEVRRATLVDFLMQKQMEGFKVVGAEQTANSTSFIDFEFPRKCVLILGHEKEGIPVNLIGYLDYAVEIPQFGVVRSLNVHVTGALFMWEYCKQHIVGGTQ